MAEFHKGFVFEFGRTAPLTIEGNPVPYKISPGKTSYIATIPPRPEELEGPKTIEESSVSALARRYIDVSDDLVRRQRVTKVHRERLLNGRVKWNQWRRKNPGIRPMLASVDFCALKHPRTNKPLVLDGYDFSYANLCQATLCGLHLKRANFHQAILAKADLSGTHLEGANFCRTDLYETNLESAHLTGANLQAALMVNTNLKKADLRRCKVYGLSAWDLILTDANQKELTVRYRPSSATGSDAEEDVVTDALDVAAFMYTTVNNRNISRILQATGRRWVLLLGRFTEGKDVLTAIAEELRRKHLTPIIFDFPPPDQRDLIETVTLLAGMSALVIVDISYPRSAAMELQAIASNYAVPIVPIIRAPAKEFGTFSALRKFHWVLPMIKYKCKTDLIAQLRKDVIARMAALAG